MYMCRDSSSISLIPLGCSGTAEWGERAAAQHKGVSSLWGYAPSTSTKTRRERKDGCELAARSQLSGQGVVHHLSELRFMSVCD